MSETVITLQPCSFVIEYNAVWNCVGSPLPSHTGIQDFKPTNVCWGQRCRNTHDKLQLYDLNKSNTEKKMWPPRMYQAKWNPVGSFHCFFPTGPTVFYCVGSWFTIWIHSDEPIASKCCHGHVWVHQPIGQLILRHLENKHIRTRDETLLVRPSSQIDWSDLDPW